MQESLRENAVGHMDPKDHQEFVDAFHNSKLVKPDEPGHVIAALAIGASNAYSGQFLMWNSDDLKQYRA